ncbi:MAG: MFS transporter, partial [Antricoccus sp.]
KLLSISIFIWCAAIVSCGAATSYSVLLITRIALGLLVAAAGPLVASLIGDLFPAAERGRIYGYILSGEIIGIGFGLLVCGNVAAALSWRYAFWVLVPPGLLLGWAIWRFLPEPSRDGTDKLEPVEQGASRTDDEIAQPAMASESDDATNPPHGSTAQTDTELRATAHQNQVLRKDPATLSMWEALRYILSIRTNLALILASALGYFYFTGLQTFAIIYFHGRYGLSQSASTNVLVLAGLGAIVGLSLAGRIADALSKRQFVGARPAVAGAAFLLCAVLLSVALLVDSLALTLPLLFLAAAALGGANPPLDAARLDIMPAQLRGRAESVRTVLRSALVALAPTLFGIMSAGLDPAHGSTGARGMKYTMLIMLAALVISGLILALIARRTFARDVATALASEQQAWGSSP